MRSLVQATSEITGEEFTLINDNGSLRLRVQDLPRYANGVGAVVHTTKLGHVELHQKGFELALGGADGTVSARALEGWGLG